MAKIEIKDISRQFRTYSADGGGEDHWLELYAVVRGDVELFVTPSRIIAERWVANQKKRKVA